jgi:hypothetical protein
VEHLLALGEVCPLANLHLTSAAAGLVATGTVRLGLTGVPQTSLRRLTRDVYGDVPMTLAA